MDALLMQVVSIIGIIATILSMFAIFFAHMNNRDIHIPRKSEYVEKALCERINQSTVDKIQSVADIVTIKIDEICDKIDSIKSDIKEIKDENKRN